MLFCICLGAVAMMTTVTAIKTLNNWFAELNAIYRFYPGI
jgi:hypothetical protein